MKKRTQVWLGGYTIVSHCAEFHRKNRDWVYAIYNTRSFLRSPIFYDTSINLYVFTAFYKYSSSVDHFVLRQKNTGMQKPCFEKGPSQSNITWHITSSKWEENVWKPVRLCLRNSAYEELMVLHSIKEYCQNSTNRYEINISTTWCFVTDLFTAKKL